MPMIVVGLLQKLGVGELNIAHNIEYLWQTHIILDLDASSNTFKDVYFHFPEI